MDYIGILVPIIRSALEQTGECPFDDDTLAALIEEPRDPSHGDRSFPCFQLAKQFRKAPPAIAAELVPHIEALLEENIPIDSVTATGPYINVRFKKSALAASLLPSVLDGSFTAQREATDTRVMIEYSQPNTHKAFHVGHCRCATLGDSLVRILEWQGDTVLAVNYFGDEGTHVARCLWYLETQYDGEIPEENLGEFLGMIYTKSTAMLDLSLMSDMPYPGMLVASVLSVDVHPEKEEWNIARLSLGDKECTVVCAGTGFSAGERVAYAPPGLRIAGKTVSIVEKKGVRSEGMICSEKELGISSDNNQIFILDKGEPGEALAEAYRKPGFTSPLSLIKEREAEISVYLQAIESGSGEIYDRWQETRQWSLDEFKEIYAWLNCRFDHNFYESEFGESSKELVQNYLKQGVFVKDEGALGADLSDEGLGFCLLVKRDGTALYACRDLALAQQKFTEYGIDKNYYVVDAGQKLHFQQVFGCLKKMGFPQASDCVHVDYGQVVRPDGKMSSRKGNVILFSELTSLLIDKITAEYLEKYRGDWSDEEIETTATSIARATIRYGMLTQDNNTQITFDIDEWTSRSGNTGPYLLYQSARIQSMLREASEFSVDQVNWELLDHEAEYDLMKHMQAYHDAIHKVIESNSPHHICSYLYDLTRKFSRMYQQCSVLHADSKERSEARLALVQAAGHIIEHGLSLIGIPVAPRM